MAKILISSLGKGKKNGEYETTVYTIDSKKYEDNSIAAVLVNHLDIDKLFVLGTGGSAWDTITNRYGADDATSLELMEKLEKSEVSQDDLQEMGELIDKHFGINGSKAWIIEYGIDQKELWHNFEIFLEVGRMIEDGDEVYLDITHSFRSLPMMSFVMMEFASQISEIDFKLAGIYYGMYEYSKDPRNIEGGTPIVDIGIIYELHQWIRAIDAMKNYGNLEPLVKLMDEWYNDEEDAEKVFVQLNNTIKMANLASIKQFVGSARKKINRLKNSNNPVVGLLSKDIEDFVQRLDKEKMSDFQYELAKWFYDNKQYALSYMALAEAVITKACEIKGYNISSKEGREAGKNYIKQTKYDDYFSQKYPNSVSRIRNNIAHQLNGREGMVNQDIVQLGEFLKNFDPFFAQ